MMAKTSTRGASRRPLVIIAGVSLIIISAVIITFACFLTLMIRGFGDATGEYTMIAVGSALVSLALGICGIYILMHLPPK